MLEKNNDKKFIGERFGRLTVVSFEKVPTGKYHAWHWTCICDCGQKTKPLRPRSVRTGEVSSCGCLKKEQNSKNLADKRRSHGKTNTRLYSIWSRMKGRCNNPDDNAYKNYGGRGISVCDSWNSKFENFYDWAVNNGYREDLTLERIDVNGGYCPKNCCWIPLSDQAKNKRNIRYVNLGGKLMPLKTACKELNLPYKTIHLRITRYGMTFEEAINRPVK